jgi:hypothetical protein
MSYKVKGKGQRGRTRSFLETLPESTLSLLVRPLFLQLDGMSIPANIYPTLYYMVCACSSTRAGILAPWRE